MNNGIPVGLGTDVGGGYTPSILDAMRMAAAANRALIAGRRDRGEILEGRDGVPLEAGEAVFLATQGGARVMGMADQLGSLDSGKLFDAIVVDLNVPLSPVPAVSSTPAVKCLEDHPDEAWRVRLEQFVFLADDRNITRVYTVARFSPNFLRMIVGLRTVGDGFGGGTRSSSSSTSVSLGETSLGASTWTSGTKADVRPPTVTKSIDSPLGSVCWLLLLLLLLLLRAFDQR
ncbi:hypothetical protein J3B02_005299 [Coemansia erecta]|nr:hypothetical protein J3B02_005299 [Coemansia erecta]